MNEALPPQQRDEFKHQLTERWDALLQEIRREVEASQHNTMEELVGLVRDTGDESLADLISGLDSALTNHHLEELRQVEAALQRLRLGTYGRCADCGEPIPTERLRSIPTALRCITCQDHHERTHAGGAHPSL